jgi:hypothetical protein
MGARRAVLGLALGLIGCSSGSAVPLASSNAPCTAGEVSFLQQQGSTLLAVQAKVTSVFVQDEGMPPYMLLVNTDGGATEAVQVKWSSPLSYGELGGMTGTVVMSGQTVCAGEDPPSKRSPPTVPPSRRSSWPCEHCRPDRPAPGCGWRAPSTSASTRRRCYRAADQGRALPTARVARRSCAHGVAWRFCARPRGA